MTDRVGYICREIWGLWSVRCIAIKLFQIIPYVDFQTLNPRFLTVCRCLEKLVFHSWHKSWSLSSLMMWNLKSYATTPRLWHFTGVKTYYDPSHIFRGQGLNLGIRASGTVSSNGLAGWSLRPAKKWRMSGFVWFLFNAFNKYWLV